MTSRIAPSTPAALGVVLAFLLAGCGGGGAGAGAKKERPPTSVTVVVATRETVPVEVSAVGTVVPFAIVSVQPRVGGQITSLAFQEGQMVAKCALLFEIDPAPFLAALAQAEAVLARDTVQSETAEAEAARYAQLVAQKLVSASEADAKIGAAKSLQATLAADRAALDTARLNLAWTKVRSPIAGRADKRQVDVGNLVQPAGAPVVVIRQLSPIQVQFALPQERLLDVQQRMKAGVLDVTATLPDHPDVVEHGKLSFVASAIETATGTISCKADFDNKSETLWPGSYVQVNVTLGTRTDVVVVPASAVQTSQQGPFAFVVTSDGTVDMRPVIASPPQHGVVVIEQGVTAGDKVVVDGQMSLVPGAKVAEKPAVGAHK